MHLTVSSKGQVVIPARMRKEMGLSPGKRLRVKRQGHSLILSKEESDFDEWLLNRRGHGRLEEPLRVDRSAGMPPAPMLK